MDMSYRRRVNSHDIWKEWCRAGAGQLEGLPEEVTRTEAQFRWFVTQGIAVDAEGTQVATIDALADHQLARLWDFIHETTQFDMDAILFDAFNTEWRRRGCPTTTTQLPR